MIPVNLQGVEQYRGSLQPATSKNIANIQGHHGHHGQTAIKRIQNFSYVVSDEIGLGLTSRVYKGKNDITNQPVAIKSIDLKSQKQSQEFIKDQIAILQKIKAMQVNNLLKLQGVILTANHLYIITEFCQGKDVAKILRQKKSISEYQAQSIMRQLINGYRQLYSMGIIHRDLKLSNLFVTNGKVKLADFGFAISEQKCQHSFSYNAGSPKYMPPESLKYNLYSFKSDAWAMGVIAYELVYGTVPWKHKDDAKLYELTTTVPIQGLFDPNVNVSDHYKTFIVNCLRPNAAQRAGPDFVFGFNWPMASNFVQGFEEEKKIPEVIKVPGKNFAVFNSDNKISYESKQMDVKDFSNSPNLPTQFILLSQLNLCKFLITIFKTIKSLNNPNLSALGQQISLTIQIVMKVLGQMACIQKNKLHTPDFDTYVKSGEWQNLKQLIIRYDIQFRNDLQTTTLPKKGSTIPLTSTLLNTILYLKSRLPENARLLDKLLTYLQIRELFAKGEPMQFAEKVNISAISQQASIPDNLFPPESVMPALSERLKKMGL